MKETRRRSLRHELSWLFAIISVLMMAVVVVGAFSYARLSDAKSKVINRLDPANVLAAELLTYYVDQETGVRGYVITNQILFLQPYNSGLSEAQTVQQRLEKVLVQDGPARRQLQLVDDAVSAWHSQFASPAIAAMQRGDRRFASGPALDQGKDLFDTLRSNFASLQKVLSHERSQDVHNLNSSSDQMAGVLIVALVLLGATGIALFAALRRRVISPLTAVGDDTRQVTSGDLGHEVGVAGPREIAELGADIEAMRARILEEVAALRDSEDQMVALNADLKRSNEELEQFAYVASHDLQEPLRKVTSFCQLLQQRYGHQLDERADQYIDFAVDGAKRMQVLINDLLAFSRIGRTSDRFEIVPLGDCAAAALANLAAAVDDADATIEIDPHLPSVMGDRGLLVSLLQNLVGNAIKFRADDRPVRVSVRSRYGGDNWQIEVEDDGIGIEPRFADRIFVIFQRLHGRDVYGGTGIGLAMCKKIVEFHGGRIWLDTDHQPGTRFCFTLPVLQRSELMPEEAPVESDQPVHTS